MSDASVQPPTSAWEMFVAFALLSMQSFGGAVTFIERTVVHRKRWLTQEEFIGVYAVSQVLPGPSGLSFCVMLGDRFFGWRGALATVAGFLLVPSVLVLSVAALFRHYEQVAAVQGALNGMGAASVGVIMTTATRMLRTLSRRRSALLVAALSFLAVGLARVPVGTVVLVLGSASVAWAWRRGRP